MGRWWKMPLMEASGAGNKDVVAALRLANATLDLVDDFGNTALHYAAHHGHLSVVGELMKSSPRKDIKNSYGHNAASYAATNKHKAIADLLNRPAKKDSQTAKELPSAKDILGDELDLITGRKHGHLQEKHVKGAAEDLHKRDKDNFAPTVETANVHGITDSERKALEEQVARLKRQHEEAELKAQKRIVELLEQSSQQQRKLDDAEREARISRLNTTEL